GDSADLALAPACTSASAEAAPAVRLRALADAFPQRNTVVPICNPDLSDLLILLVGFDATVIGSPCMEGDLDRDPETPGAQVECVVSDVRCPGTDQQQETVIPPCAAGSSLPCWRMEEDRQNCPETPTGLVLDVQRHDWPQVGTHVQARCLTLCD
ncbi:MAG TPA: hypothetical protein VL172_07240, partial [Kofleriaceae bacterium]|nr:hypothetical protein [Kofleriaceae bacterium]